MSARNFNDQVSSAVPRIYVNNTLSNLRTGRIADPRGTEWIHLVLQTDEFIQHHSAMYIHTATLQTPISYNGPHHIHSQNYPFPWTDPQTQLPASSLDPFGPPAIPNC